MREVIKDILSREGYEFVESADGDTAYSTAVSEKPDVILLDVTMPIMNGFEVLKRLKDDPSTRTIPVVMMTARRLPRYETLAMKLGAADYITKPFSSGEVQDRVRLALRT